METKSPWGFTTFQDCKGVLQSESLRTTIAQPGFPGLPATCPGDHTCGEQPSHLMLPLHLAFRGHCLNVARLVVEFLGGGVPPKRHVLVLWDEEVQW